MVTAWRAAGLALGLIFGAAAPAAAPEVPGADQIVTRTLPNGMKLVVWPDKDIPNVAMYTWYRVGSRNERPGITGISHFFEHMMFNGTKTRAPGEFDRVMEGSGGRNNAYTSSDVTVYQNWFPSSVTGLDLRPRVGSHAQSRLRRREGRKRARRGVFRAPLVGRQRQLRHADRADAGDRFRRASLPDTDHRLAFRHRRLEGHGPAGLLPPVLRAEQRGDVHRGRRRSRGGVQAGRPVPGQHSGAARATRRHDEGAAATRRAPPADRARCPDAVDCHGMAHGRSVRSRGAGHGSAAVDPR